MENKGTKMKDGTLAWLSHSGNYYIRREWKGKPAEDINEWDGIAYYDKKKKTRIPLAKGKCKKCGEVIESKHCGDFVSCKCGTSFVDTDRWSPERHRYGGEVE